MTEVLDQTVETVVAEDMPLTPELDRERLEFIESAMAGRTLNLCTNKIDFNSVAPETALARAGLTHNND